MRILFINTLDESGGAAIITQRLMNGLREMYNTENHLLVKTKEGTAQNTAQILTSGMPVISEKIIDRVTRSLGLLYQFFPFSSRKILEAAKTFQPDVINLHNTHGAYFATPLLEKLSRVAPIVWTLHDMWSFTANASHSFGNMSWKYLKNDADQKKIPPVIGINTGSWLLKQKKRIYAHSDLTIVTPSLWLKKLAIQSPLFAGKQIQHIYNGIYTSVFKPLDKQFAKKKLQLPVGKTIMFSSHFLRKNNPWKGGHDLLEILQKIDSRSTEKINLLILGEGTFDELNALKNFNVFYKGYVKDELEMVTCLNAADLFVYPTRADNLPNVLIESIACGTPCITFDIGGNSEIIRHDFNGIVIDPFDFTNFALKTVDLLYNEQQLKAYANNCLVITKELFLINLMIDRYHSLFEQVIAARKNAQTRK